MLPAVQRLIFATQLRDAFLEANDPAARKPLDAQDRGSLESTIAALTESGPPSREMVDIQLSILTRLPGWPTGLRVVRLMAPDSGLPPDPTLAGDQRQFGAQTSQLALGDPLLIYRQSDGSWFYARNATPPQDWRPAPDRRRPLLSACIAALVERYKDEGWLIVARLAADSSHKPGRANEAVLLAKLQLQMAEWLRRTSDQDEKYPLLWTAPATPRRDPPHVEAAPTTGAAQIIHAAAWSEGHPTKRRRRHASSIHPPASPPPTTCNGNSSVLTEWFPDDLLLELLKAPVTPSPNAKLGDMPPMKQQHAASSNNVVDLTGGASCPAN